MPVVDPVARWGVARTSGLWPAQPDWRFVTVFGLRYLAVKCPGHPRAWKNGYVYVHILVAEQKIGRLLSVGEEVHHENEDTLDNKPGNITVLPSKADHAALHGRKRGRWVELTCEECGIVFRRAARLVGRNRHIFCSYRCAGTASRRAQLAAGVRLGRRRLVVQMDRTPLSERGDRAFESRPACHGSMAQLEAQRIPNPPVGRSSRPRPASACRAVGSAPVSGIGGRWFKSSHADH